MFCSSGTTWLTESISAYWSRAENIKAKMLSLGEEVSEPAFSPLQDTESDVGLGKLQGKDIIVRYRSAQGWSRVTVACKSAHTSNFHL